MALKMRVGLLGYGKAGSAVANVLVSDPRYELRWIARRSTSLELKVHPGTEIPIIGMDQHTFAEILESMPVDALVDFSSANSIHEYGEEIRKRGIMLVSAISAYSDDDLVYARGLGKNLRVLCMLRLLHRCLMLVQEGVLLSLWWRYPVVRRKCGGRGLRLGVL